MQGFLSLGQNGEELNRSQSKSILKIVGAQFVRPLKGFYTSLLPCWVIALSLSKLTITTAQQQLSYMTFLHKCGITIPWHSYHKHQPEASVLFRLSVREWLTWSGFLFTWHIEKIPAIASQFARPSEHVKTNGMGKNHSATRTSIWSYTRDVLCVTEFCTVPKKLPTLQK